MTPPSRPESPGSKTIIPPTTTPADLDPDLAAMGMIKDMLKGMDAPSDISKAFNVRKAIYKAINHTQDNPTGYNAELRLTLYNSYEKGSLNIDAKLFNSFMAFLMKPKMIIQGLPQTPQSTEPGFLQRALGRLTGRGQPQQPQTVQQ